MTDVMEQLRAAQPMPRGERLATWLEHRSTGTQFIGRAWRFLGEHDLPFGKHIRAHAAPLALARERRRRERAEAWLDHRMGQLAQAQEDIASLRADVIEYEAQMHAARGEAVERLEQARHWREQAKAAEAEMLRLRAAAPTREEVERAEDMARDCEAELWARVSAHSAHVSAQRAENADLRAEVARLTPAPEKEVEADGLSPCPFCAGRAVLIAGERLNADEQYHWVRCVQCAAEGPWTKNRGGACRKWNAAAVPTREEVERAVDALEQSLAALEVPDEAALDAAGDRYDAARAALVALATRGRG